MLFPVAVFAAFTFGAYLGYGVFLAGLWLGVGLCYASGLPSISTDRSRPALAGEFVGRCIFWPTAMWGTKQRTGRIFG